MPKSTVPSKPLPITIRDGVHLDIAFTPVESNVIDTPQIQRLRNIKQLGFTYLVYPSAVHTRFEHSVGTCYLTGLLLDRITKNTGHKFSKDERAIARIFALIHDASHIPFGHTLEDEHNVFSRHDKGTRLLKIVDQPELRSALDIYYEPIRVIAEFVGQDSRTRSKIDNPRVKPYLVDVVAGTIGADLLDYLQRDNLFTGLRREYDPRVYDYFTVRDDRIVINLTKHEMVRRDAVSDVMDLLRMRYTLTEKVYYHHTKLSFGAVLAKAVRIAKERGFINERVLAQMGDWDLLHYLSTGPKLPKSIRTLVNRITPRGIYRRAYALPRSYFGAADDEFNDFVHKYRADTTDINELESNIAKVAKVPFEDIVVYCPSSQMQLKEAKVSAYAHRKVGPLIDMKADDAQEAKLYYEKFKELWTFYVFAYGDHETAAKVSNATKEVLDRPNDYDPTS